ncbi:MAG TPA: hypothetical protein VL096_07535 [Pirellulaceae bacterium]|nr:hypothetical protein [Pirellulaceae bacterium]
MTISSGPEEALDSWRFSHPNSEDELAVHEALDALDQGEVGLPLDQFDLEFRRRNGLPTR